MVGKKLKISVALLYKWKAEKEMRETTPFTIASNNISWYVFYNVFINFII